MKKHLFIITSDSPNADVKQIRISTWVVAMTVLVICALIGGAIGYVYYEQSIWKVALAKSAEQAETIKVLSKENAELEEKLAQEQEKYDGEIENLNTEILLLSNTLQEKLVIEEELSKIIEKQSIPTDLPLSGAAQYELIEGSEPLCIFKAAEQTAVLATAAGTVMAVNEDLEYGSNIWIDHGNGYISIYRNKGVATVKKGDKVVSGTTLYLISEDNSSLGYQIMQDGLYVDPLSIMEING